jgi:membrane-bound inhibitor of C-type lysozyme
LTGHLAVDSIDGPLTHAVAAIHSLTRALAALSAGVAITSLGLITPQVAVAEEPAHVVHYACRGAFDVRSIWALFFHQQPAEVILIHAGTHSGDRLLQRRSASGARYGDGDQEFWIKGDTATWQRGGTYQCKAVQTER